jgi:hypothetical protein
MDDYGDIPRWRVLRRLRALEHQVMRLDGKLKATAVFTMPADAVETLWPGDPRPRNGFSDA